MESENVCLEWKDFQENTSSLCRELRYDHNFSDVTLACEDGQINAHKVILSASSLVLRSILKSNKHSHPFIYLRSFRKKDIEQIIDFIYNGKVEISKEQLDTFLRTAEELGVKGLEGAVKENGEIPQKTDQAVGPNTTGGKANISTETFQNNSQTNPISTSLEINKEEVAEIKILDKSVTSSLSELDLILKEFPKKSKPYGRVCQNCGKSCKGCGVQSISTGSLQDHITTKHRAASVSSQTSRSSTKSVSYIHPLAPSFDD